MYAELIKQLPDIKACLKLIDCFDGLLKKYARLLNYEDAYNDVVLFFIELINKLHGELWVGTNSDGKIVNYIQKALRNEYIRLSKKQSSLRTIAFTDLNIDNNSPVEKLLSKEAETKLYEYFPKDATLSMLEKQTIIMIFGYGYTVSEIATISGKSRQAINQTKLRALSKLEKIL